MKLKHFALVAAAVVCACSSLRAEIINFVIFTEVANHVTESGGSMNYFSSAAGDGISISPETSSLSFSFTPDEAGRFVFDYVEDQTNYFAVGMVFGTVADITGDTLDGPFSTDTTFHGISGSEPLSFTTVVVDNYGISQFFVIVYYMVTSDFSFSGIDVTVSGFSGLGPYEYAADRTSSGLYALTYGSTDVTGVLTFTSEIPEPSEYGAVLGIAGLAFVAFARSRRKRNGAAETGSLPTA